MKQQRLSDVEAKKAQKEVAFNEKEAKKAVKEAAEAPEREALDKIRAEEERLQQIKKEEQKLENEKKALEYFAKLDIDQVKSFSSLSNRCKPTFLLIFDSMLVKFLT